MICCIAGKETAVKTTINLDDELLAKAHRISGTKERPKLIHDALQALIERENARRLARLGGTQPDLETMHRRRSDFT